MNMRILVAYATKHGATAEIAEKIGAALQDAGLNVDVMPVDYVGNVEEYPAVVLGSAVYVGKWRKEAVQFLEKNEVALAERDVWLFSSGPTGEGEAEALLQGWRFPEAQKPIADRIHPHDIAVFHGELNTEKLNFMEKFVIKNVKAPVGDFRDWDDITTWATSIAQSLMDPVF